MPLPTLPQAEVDITYSLPTGQTHNPNTGAELDTLLSGGTLDGKTLALGDVVVLDAGTDYGNIQIPNLGAGSDYIYVISSALASLPAFGYRSAGSGTNMPRFSTSANASITTANTAHHFRFVGVHVEADNNVSVSSLIDLGSGATSVGQLPHHIIFDRCYIHGQGGTGNATRGIRTEADHVGIINSYIDNFRSTAGDSQAVSGANFQGPLLIENCFLEGASENVMIGGYPLDFAVVASDITIKRNHMFKRLSWAGTGVHVKNIMEFKLGVRALVEGNLFENVWAEDQVGAMTNCGPAPEESGDVADGLALTDITYRYNFGVNCEVGFQFGRGSFSPPPLERVLGHDNVILIGEPASGNSRAIQSTGQGGPIDLYLRKNTILIPGGAGNSGFFEHNDPSYVAGPTIEMTDNILMRGAGGIDGSGSSEGTDTFDTHHDTYTVTTNAFIGAASGSYPANNYFPTNVAAMNFVNYQDDGSGDYSLTPGTTYAAGGASDASDGTDLGADWDTVKAMTDAAEAGIPYSDGGGGGAKNWRGIHARRRQ